MEFSESQFLGTHDFDDMSPLETGVFKKTHSDKYQTKGGKSIDPRLATVLEYFKELYDLQRDLFRNIFPGIHEEFSEFLKKLGVVISHHVNTDDGHHKIDVKTMQRSLSVGSPRSRSVEGDQSGLKLERFKIKTVSPKGGGQGDDSGGDGGGGGKDQGGKAPGTK